MKKLRTFIIVASLVLVFILAGAHKISAFDALGNTCDSSDNSQSGIRANNSAVCSEKNSPGQSATSTQDTINKITNIMAVVAGIMAVVYILISGLSMIMSTGDSAKLQKARESIIYAAVGIVIIALARVIIATIVRYI